MVSRCIGADERERRAVAASRDVRLALAEIHAQIREPGENGPGREPVEMDQIAARDHSDRVVARRRLGAVRGQGVAELRAGDAIVGSTRYSLPARPGRAAAKDELLVDLSTPVARSALRLTTRPLPSRPVLDPPKPSWDTSIPW